ncbi:MAG: uracil-DNA glycosylase [Candidatus Yanofskybacteria bacterium]|nr:uracil-DNA glycosylase [Candidatus Yanofskybacteria bacterium]
MQPQDRTELLRVIRDEVLALATPLALARKEGGTHPVIGEGSHFAKVMLIGEAPGRNEAATGRPFVGAAGKMLDTLLASVEIPRSDVYITNIVKDRPPFNRDPLPDEIAAYGPFLDRQITIIQPAVIVTLGRYAMGYVMEKFGLADQLKPISALHGTVQSAQAAYGPITIVPLYHPAVAVYNAATKDTLVADMQILRQFDLKPAVSSGD